MLKKFIPIALALVLSAGASTHTIAADRQIDPLLLSYFLTEVNGAYSDGDSMIYLAYFDRLALVIGGRAIGVELQSLDMEKSLVNFTINRNGKTELVTFERFGSFASMTMGDGSIIRMRFVRPLGDFDMKAIVDSGALGDQGAPAAAAQPEAPVATAAVTPAAAPAATAVPSFDCAKASTAIEGMICGSPELAELDGRLAESYREVRQRADDPEIEKREQVKWVREVRGACKTVQCLQDAYAERVNDLELLAQYLSKPREFR